MGTIKTLRTDVSANLAKFNVNAKRKGTGTHVFATVIVVIAIVVVSILTFAVALIPFAIFLGAIAAVVWGVVDISHHGVNFWAVAWIVIGGFILLRAVFSKSK
jgi:hypothetical protein